MPEIIKGIRTQNGVAQYDYESLANNTHFKKANLACNVTVGKGISNSTGNVIDLASWSATKDMRPVNEATTMICSLINTSQAPNLNSRFTLAFYDSNGNFIINMKPGSVKNYAVTVPNGASYYRFSILNTLPLSDIVLSFGNEICDYYVAPTYLDCEPYANYMNKKILYLGDSITYLGVTGGNRGWPNWCNGILQPYNYYISAVNGATWRDKEGTVYDGNPQESNPTNNTIGNQIQKILNDKADYEPDVQDFDIIIFAAGTNDIQYGNIDDENVNAQFYDNNNLLIPLADADRKTFAGIMRYATETLAAAYPNAIFFVCSPIQAAETVRTLDNIKKVRKLLHDAADRISIQFIDTFECGITGVYEVSMQEGRDLKDGLHPLAGGAKKMGNYNANKIANYYNMKLWRDS